MVPIIHNSILQNFIQPHSKSVSMNFMNINNSPQKQLPFINNKSFKSKKKIPILRKDLFLMEILEKRKGIKLFKPLNLKTASMPNTSRSNAKESIEIFNKMYQTNLKQHIFLSPQSFHSKNYNVSNHHNTNGILTYRNKFEKTKPNSSLVMKLNKPDVTVPLRTDSKTNLCINRDDLMKGYKLSSEKSSRLVLDVKNKSIIDKSKMIRVVYTNTNKTIKNNNKNLK